MPPGKPFLAAAKTCEITPASRTAIRGRPKTQQDLGPVRRVIILLAPGSQLLAIATGTARVSPGATEPNAGIPAVPATAAAKRIDADHAAKDLRHGLPVRHPDITGATFRARKLHSQPSPIDACGNAISIII